MSSYHNQTTATTKQILLVFIGGTTFFLALGALISWILQ